MTRKSRHISGAPLTLCLILVLGATFLAPLYHTHDHAGDFHDRGGHDHILLHDASTGEILVADDEPGPHLHLLKNSTEAVLHLHLKSTLLRTALCAVTARPMLCGYYACSRSAFTRAALFRSNTCDCLSGLSPPAA